MKETAERLSPAIGLEQAIQYGDYLIDSDFCTISEPDCGMYSNRRNDLLQWNNPENIDSGVSGAILFIIELYKHTGDEKYAAFIDSGIQNLMDYCEQHPSNNYSLYTGRLGVVYVMMQWHAVTKNPVWLKNCVDMVKPAGTLYLHAEYTSNALYDGRAGALLLIMQLYVVSGDESLTDIILQFCTKIMLDARVSDDGICWQAKQEVSPAPSSAFASGAAGVKFVFDFMNRYSNAPALAYIIDGINRFIEVRCADKLTDQAGYPSCITNRRYLDEYINTDSANEPALVHASGWANGKAGMSIARYVANNDNSQSAGSGHCKNGGACQYVAGSITIFDGLAGIGLSALATGKKEGCSGVNNMVRMINEQMLLSSAETDIKGGLFHGKLGVLYFLLKASGTGRCEENIAAPFLNTSLQHTAETGSLVPGLDRVRKSVIAAKFPRTMHLVEAKAPQLLDAYLNQPQAAGATGEINGFSAFLTANIKLRVFGALKERLTDVFLLENELLSLQRSATASPVQLYRDGLKRQEKTISLLSMPDEYLLNEELVVAQEVKVLSTKWNWGFKDDFKQMNNTLTQESHLANLKLPSGLFEYIYIHYGEAGTAEQCLRSDSVELLHYFDRPCTINQALEKVRADIQSLTDDELKLRLAQLEVTGFSTKNELIELLDDMLFYEIRQWIYGNILVTKN
jgi:Lanthionine synthetase C-like protein